MTRSQAVLYAKFPLLCTGIVAFDILIANRDRGKWNIKIDNPDNPSLVRVIDHERSLFYAYPDEGEQQLLSRVDRFGITPSTVSDSGRHCLIELVNDSEMLFHWVQRIWSIPHWFITDICQEVRKLSITESECKAVTKFLIERAKGIGDLINKNHDRFPMVKKWENLWI